MLSCGVLIHPCFYARLTYSIVYHYGWEIRCIAQGGAIAFRYDRYFPSPTERQQNLGQLMADLEMYYEQLSDAVSEISPPASPPDTTASPLRPTPTVTPSVTPTPVKTLPRSLIRASQDGDGAWRIQLVVPINGMAEPIRFTSDRVYRFEAEAIATGEALLEQLFIGIRKQEYYCGVVLQDADGLGEHQKPAKDAAYFGYALKNVEGQVIAEPSLINHEGEKLEGSVDLPVGSTYRFITKEERELALQQWFCHLEANQNQFEFSVFREKKGTWKFQLIPLVEQPDSQPNNQPEDQSEDSENPQFTSVKSYQTVEAAWEAATVAASSLRYRRRYVDCTIPPNAHCVEITDESGHPLMNTRTNEDLNTLFQQFNDLKPFLQFEAVEVPVKDSAMIIPFALPDPSAETTTQYRYCLVDRTIDQTTGTDQTAETMTTLENKPAVSLLQSINTYADQDIARNRFYQDVLAVLFEPGVIAPTQNRDGFGFRLLSQPRDLLTEVAENAQPYATEEERDDALEQLLRLVRTARYMIEALPLAQFLPVYKPAPDQSSLSVPQEAVPQEAVPQESVPQALAPQYIGQIRPNDGPVLLQGQWVYTDENTAWEQGDILIELLQERRNFRLIKEERDGDGVFGWELINPEDQIWGRQYYACKSEHTQAIKKLQCWANDEGFYVLEHILLRPRSQQLSLVQTDTLQTSVPDINAHNQELDKFLSIIVRSDDPKYPLTDPDRLARHDPYSFWVTIVLPYWPRRFRDVDFRRFVERTLRLEAPAHIALKIAWVNVQQLQQFQTAYRAWLEQLAQYSCQGTACHFTRTLNQLLEILPRLRNVYPKATLHNCDQNRPGDSPILLNQTAIGTAND